MLTLLNRVLREEFVRIYSESVLQNFLNEQRKVHPGVDLPELPQAGNRDNPPGNLIAVFFA
jgi:hypothetical protein